VSVNDGWGNIARAFSNKHYRTYQIGRFVSQITTWMYKVAVGWMAWKLTHSAGWLGFFGFLDQAPALLIMPIAGAVADRTDSLKYMRVTQALLLMQAIGLALLDAFDLLSLSALIVFTLAYGTINAAQQPASQAILPNLMPKNQLTVAYGLNSVLFNVARFMGPMIAGAMISEWGTAPAIFCNAIGAATFQVCLIFMQQDFAMPQRARSKSHNMLRDVQDGFYYAIRHKGIGPTMVILSTLSIMPFTVDLLLPSLADGVFHAGAKGLAWMTACIGTGAMVQAMLIARRGDVAGLSGYVIHAIVWLALGFFALAFSGNIWFALACIFTIGVASSATRVGSMTLLQYSVDVNMRGRVASFYGLITHAGPALGALMVGALGDRVGMPVMMAVVGGFTLLVWAWATTKRTDMTAALEAEAHASL
jgi:MFS family permease